MTNPTAEAIAQAFWERRETVKKWDPGVQTRTGFVLDGIESRARTIDASRAQQAKDAPIDLAGLEAHRRSSSKTKSLPDLSEQAGGDGAEAKLSKAGVFKGMHGLRGLLEAREFWDRQPYCTRLYYGDGIADYLHRGVLETAVQLLDAKPEDGGVHPLPPYTKCPYCGGINKPGCEPLCCEEYTQRPEGGEWCAYIEGYVKGANDYAREPFDLVDARIIAEGDAIFAGLEPAAPAQPAVGELAGIRDTLIVAANNPASHGGERGLREIMKAQAKRIDAAFSFPTINTAPSAADCEDCKWNPGLCDTHDKSPPAVGEGDVLDGEFLLCVDPNNPDGELIPLQWGLSTGAGKTARTLLHFKDANTAPPSREVGDAVDFELVQQNLDRALSHLSEANEALSRRRIELAVSELSEVKHYIQHCVDELPDTNTATPTQPPVQDARDGVAAWMDYQPQVSDPKFGPEPSFRELLRRYYSAGAIPEERIESHVSSYIASLDSQMQQADGGAVAEIVMCEGIGDHTVLKWKDGLIPFLRQHPLGTKLYASNPPKSPVVSVDEVMTRLDKVADYAGYIEDGDTVVIPLSAIRTALLAAIGGVKP